MLNPVETPIECPVPSEARDQFRLLFRVYAHRRPLLVGQAFDAEQVALVTGLVWHLGVWPELINELLMLNRMFLYDDLVQILKIEHVLVLSFRDPLIMQTALERFLGEDLRLVTRQPLLLAIAA